MMMTEEKWNELLYINNSNMERSINKLRSITELLYNINAVYKMYVGTVLVDDDAKGYAQRSELEFYIFIKKDLYEFYVTISSRRTKITISHTVNTEINVSISTNETNLLEHDGYFDEMDKFHTILFKFYTAKDIKELIDLLKNIAYYEISFSK